MPNLGYHLGSSRVISGHLGTKVCEAGCSALILNALDQLCWPHTPAGLQLILAT